MRRLQILLIEDDAIEVMKFNRSLKSLELNHSVTMANNGEKALEWLKTTDQLPHVILLDLNMPKINGIEFLRLMKADARLKYIPTVIITTSSNDKDLKACYEIGVAGYMLKPLKYDDYISKIKALLNYWSFNELIVN